MSEQTHKETPADIAAVVLSWVLNPLIAPALVFALLLFQFGASPDGIFHGTLIAIGFFFVIPGIGILWLRMKGMIDSFDIRSKEKRAIPVLLGLACNLAAIVVIARVSFPSQPAILTTSLAFFLAGVIILFVTRHWKISIHLTTYAAVVCALFVMQFDWGPEMTGIRGIMELPRYVFIGLLLGAPLLMWARVHCKVHTVPQVVVGFLFGGLCHFAGYWILSSL